jgi:hypothetical protein
VTGSQDGSTLVETLLVGLLSMVPLIWLLTVLADVHRGALASTAAAREAGADAGRSTSVAEANGAVDEAVARAFLDHGIPASEAEVSWTTSGGLERGAAVEVQVTYAVPVFQAPFLGGVGPSIDITARHVARVDPYRSRPGP